MTVVRDPQYRQYRLQRETANSAIMALLTGSQLAAHTLQLTTGSSRLLAEIFPQVPHIHRFNLKTETATELLTSAEQHLGNMGVPYVLSLHEDYILTSLRRIQAEGLTTALRLRTVKAWNMHEHLERATGGKFSADSLAAYHFLREARNCLIHSGGRVERSLEVRRRKLPPGAVILLEQYTKQALPAYTVGDQLSVSHAEIVAALAVTDTLADESNVILQSTLSESTWANLIVSDYLSSTSSTTQNRSRDKVLHSVKTLIRRNYSPISIPDAKLLSTMKEAGVRLRP